MKVFGFFMLIFLIYQSNAQDELDSLIDNRPCQFLELTEFGNVSVFSASYGHILKVGNVFYGSIGGGLGYAQDVNIFNIATSRDPETYLTLPYYFTAMLGKTRHFAEIGIGGTFVFGDLEKYHYLYPMLGYRLQPLRSNRLHFKFYASMLNTNSPDNLWIIPVGMALGFNF
ncbi:MAG: hypothetical protein JXR53_11685 [Bacteroidales bacterium]|nr:hypothetical protein [Bacteroidales bacterium]